VPAVSDRTLERRAPLASGEDRRIEHRRVGAHVTGHRRRDERRAVTIVHYTSGITPEHATTGEQIRPE
jgi:hypothetical protein